MKRINLINLSKTLIVFSLVVLFSGVAFNFNNDRKLINPKNDTYLLSPNKDKNGTISITTIDENEVNGGKPTSNNNSSTNNNSNNSDVSNYSNSTNTYPKSNNIDDINNNLRNSIQSKFNITVKYGNETNGYSAADLKTIPVTDKNMINSSLNDLNNNLSIYPINMFSEIKSGGYNLTIYLIKKYSADNVTGITDSNNKKVIISLATDYQFRESLHHELYHYIENYMYSRGLRYTEWNSLNPTKFKYGKHNSSLSYSYTRDPDAYFVNNYAQTSAEEDRASTFEYMTAANKSSCLNNGKPIWLKAKYICEQIDSVFNSVSPNTKEYWERYVY